MQASVGGTAAALSALGAGERFWFWFSPDLSTEAPRLLVTSLQADPGMEALTATTDAMTLPMGGRMSMGLASVNSDGRVQLGAPGLSATHLSALAEWVQHNADDHPALGRLKDARMMTIQPDGRVSDAFESADLWDGLTAPAAPGTLAGEAEVLASLPVGENARFWMCADGPRMVIVPVSLDPKGDMFRSRIRAHQRAVGSAPVFAGILRTTTAAVVLTTAADLSGAAGIVESLLGTGRAARLSGARIIRMKNGQFVEAVSLKAKGPDLSREQGILAGLSESDRLVFWFTRDGAAGQPHLVLETDRDRLKGAAQATGLRGTAIRGQARMTSKGWIEFRSQKDMPDFVAALARFVAAHRSAFPALARLKGARMTVRDRDGEITARHRDDAAWKTLS